MKKLISLVMLVAHTTSFAVDTTRIQIHANGSEATKVVTGADALQLQHDQWQHDDQQAAKAKQTSDEYRAKCVETTNATFHDAVVTGDASTVEWALVPSEYVRYTATNINTPINGFNALPLEVALDQLIKTADTYNHPTANRVMDVANDLSDPVGTLGVYYSLMGGLLYGLSSLDHNRLVTSKASADEITKAASSCGGYQGILILGGALVSAAILLKAPQFFHSIYNMAAESSENLYAYYWNKLKTRFAIARTILNCNKVDLSAAVFNTPQAQRALEFIRTSDKTVTTYKQFVADVKAGKYETLRLCNKA